MKIIILVLGQNILVTQPRGFKLKSILMQSYFPHYKIIEWFPASLDINPTENLPIIKIDLYKNVKQYSSPDLLKSIKTTVSNVQNEIVEKLIKING